jgi:hypothetical protein
MAPHARGFPPGEHALEVPLARGRNEVRIMLTNAIGKKAQVLTLSHEGDGALDKRGTLYLLAIGIDKYPDRGSARLLGAPASTIGSSAPT